MKDIETATAGDIIILSGADDVKIGDTICVKENPVALPRVDVDKPTISMGFGVNTSPFSGLDGKKVSGNQIRERLEKEALMNVAIELEVTNADMFVVKGRGEF